MGFPKFVVAVAAFGVFALGVGSAEAALFVSTGQTGAQVQVDRNHTQSWTYSVSAPVTNVDGGLFVMKRGPNTSTAITFEIFAGTLAQRGTVPSLLSVTRLPADFGQSYANVLFASTPVTLQPNTIYTAVLSSSAVDAQNEAYFIKGGSLRFVNETGVTVTPGGGGTITPPTVIPEPAAVSLLLAGPMALLARRRR